MKALVTDGSGRFAVESVPDPIPAPGEAVVAVRAAGICGSDLHILDGQSPDAAYPLIPGHELAGEVVDLGTGETSLQVGTRVAVDPSIYCHACRLCRRGKSNLCERRAAIGVTRPGGFAEFVSVPTTCLHELPTRLSYELGAMAEPLSCVVRGADRLQVQVGAEVLILGMGTIGLLMLRTLRLAGAVSVAAVDIDENRLKHASDLGAAEVTADIDALLRDRGRGFDYVVECTGVTAAVEAAIQAVDPGGTVMVFGVPPANAVSGIRPFDVYRRELTITGSMAVLDSYSRAIALTDADSTTVQRLVTHQMNIDDAVTAVEVTRNRGGGKVQLTFS